MALDVKSQINIDARPIYDTDAARLCDISWNKLQDKPDFLPTTGGTMTDTIISEHQVALKQTLPDGRYAAVGFSGNTASHAIYDANGEYRALKVYRKGVSHINNCAVLTESDQTGVGKDYYLWGTHNFPVESGVWTPSLIGAGDGGTCVYGQQVGRYTRIGKMVFYFISLSLTAKDNAMKEALILTGFPFPHANYANIRYINTSIKLIGLASNLSPLDFCFYGNFTLLGVNFLKRVNDSSFFILNTPDITNTFGVTATGFYPID